MNLSAQVTIGSGISPERGALLDHKETDATNPTSDVTSLENATKGVLYPKVFLRDAAKLTPLYGGVDTGGGVWSDNATADEKLKATGMVVYNVNPKAINMDEGLYMWNMDEWVKLNQDGAAVIGPVDCSAIRINGSYIEGTPVTGNEYLEIDLDVTKKGSFVIAALSGNGYSFFYTGVALETGRITVKVPAQGTPALVRTDELKFSGISLVAGCEPKITVQEKIAEYEMVCSATVVQGQYVKNRTLQNGTHVITMQINVSQSGSYNIYTETKNGIYFKGSGSFASAGRQTVILQGYGKPTINEDIQLTIKANTPLSSLECSAIIPVTLPAMKYAIIGATDLYNYSWNGGPRENALKAARNFGADGVVKMESPLSSLWNVGTNLGNAVNYLNNGYGTGAIKEYPDIVLYFSFGAPPSSALATALYNYVHAGGCLIFATADNGSNGYSRDNVNYMISGLFAGLSTAQTQTGGGDDNVYQIANNSADPIINGPFGNLAGMYWGEDNASNNSFVLTSLPPNSVQVCTAQSTSKTGIDSDYSIVWYNNSKNFVYFGDSTGSDTNNNSSDATPTTFDSAYKPKSKLYGPGDATYKRVVYNSALELNAVAWAIRKAAVSGINPW
ncbi:hypothetical protein FACS1894169_09830 [Bacteroidia bacterium]|nr:hypothetical protein FACS1894169_09830 [Bacteroidia bacterium]